MTTNWARQARALQEAASADPTNVKLLQKWCDAAWRANETAMTGEACARLADLYAGDGYFLKAIAVLKHATELDSTRSDLFFRLVDLSLGIGGPNEAIGWFRRAVETGGLRRHRPTFVTMARRLVAAEPSRLRWQLYLACVLVRSNSVERQEAVALLTALGPRLREQSPELAESLAAQLATNDVDVGALVAAVDAMAERLRVLELATHATMILPTA